MNKKKIRNYQIFSVIFIFVLGSLLHFTYEWSGENRIVAMFSAVNESVWEHLKLMYFPMLITILIGYFYLGKQYKNFICSKTIGLLIAMAFITVFFYTYSGIIGESISVIDISSFFLATMLGEFIAYLLIVNNFECSKKTAVIILVLICTCFIFYTYYPPKIGLFKDPITGGFGIKYNQKMLDNN